MGNPPPLSVDPEQLGMAGGQLLSSAAQLPAAPAPFKPMGNDPLSLAIIGQIPAIDDPVIAQLPAVQAQSTKTANSVVDAAQAYSSTDQQLGGQISQEMQNTSGLPGTGSGSPAAGSSGADSMGQMMSMPMQMAGQMAQMPMQVMGAVAAVPQGVMQGAQQVGQQVSQMAGQFGQGGQGDAAGGIDLPGGELPEAEQADEQPPEAPMEEERDEQDGAAAGRQGSERAPDSSESGSPGTPSGRHRLAEPPGATNDSINL